MLIIARLRTERLGHRVSLQRRDHPSRSHSGIRKRRDFFRGDIGSRASPILSSALSVWYIRPDQGRQWVCFFDQV